MLFCYNNLHLFFCALSLFRGAHNYKVRWGHPFTLTTIGPESVDGRAMREDSLDSC